MVRFSIHIDLDWYYLVAPNALLGIGPSVVTVTSLNSSRSEPLLYEGFTFGGLFYYHWNLQFIGSIL